MSVGGPQVLLPHLRRGLQGRRTEGRAAVGLQHGGTPLQGVLWQVFVDIGNGLWLFYGYMGLLRVGRCWQRRQCGEGKGEGRKRKHVYWQEAHGSRVARATFFSSFLFSVYTFLHMRWTGGGWGYEYLTGNSCSEDCVRALRVPCCDWSSATTCLVTCYAESVSKCRYVFVVPI